jgi:hypothetical protein
VAEVTYILCAATSMWAAVLLLMQYRRRPTRLLYWSALGFGGLALNNVLVVVDLLMFPGVDLTAARAFVAAIAMLVFMGGLISETA